MHWLAWSNATLHYNKEMQISHGYTDRKNMDNKQHDTQLMLFCRIGPLAGNHIFRIDRFTVKTASDPKGMPSTSYFAQIVNWLIFLLFASFTVCITEKYLL